MNKEYTSIKLTKELAHKIRAIKVREEAKVITINDAVENVLVQYAEKHGLPSEGE